MQQYILKRIALMIPTLLGITLVISLSVRFLPGDIIDQVLGEQASYVNEETREALEQRFSLDKHPVEQYGYWLLDLSRGDLGRSFISGRAISDDLKARMPVSFQLGIMALIFAFVTGLPIGVLAAVRQDSWADYLVRSTAIMLLAIPNFWIGLLVIAYGFIWFGYTPPLSYVDFWDDPSSNLRTLVIPAMILGGGTAGSIMRFTRATMLEVLRQDYVRTGWSKGLNERVVVFRHALRNAIIPVVTVVGLQVPSLVGGTIVLERIFSIPGMGAYLLQAINQRDFPVVQAVVLVSAIVVVFSNLIVDLLYPIIDPRIRVG
jgi:peptide/nickel transport system permease protein